jgi:hypothetical protein
MIKKKKIILTLLCIIAFMTVLSINVSADVISEDELKIQVESRSKAEVSGSVFIWFLCAVAFLKISQKIDSFMSSLGINVGNTGGSMLGEAIIAMRGLSIIKNIGKGGAGSASSAAGSGSAASSGFAPGTFANMVRRNPANTNNALNQNAGNPALNSPAAQTNSTLSGGSGGNNSGALPGSAVPQLASGSPAGQGALAALPPAPPNSQFSSGNGDNTSDLSPASFNDSQLASGESSITQNEISTISSESSAPQITAGEGADSVNQIQQSSSPSAPIVSRTLNSESLNHAGQVQISASQAESAALHNISGADSACRVITAVLEHIRKWELYRHNIGITRRTARYRQ